MMKTKLLTLAMFVMLACGAQAQVFGTNCPTMEQQQAAYNQKMASAIIVRDTTSQQLQTYYSQLATYWQQRHTANQQMAKDQQQKDKDIQQLQKDEQQKACDKALIIRKVELDNLSSEGYDELKYFIEVILPLLGDCDTQLKEELKRIHANRSGGGDSTNPAGGGNIRGFDNPHKVR